MFELIKEWYYRRFSDPHAVSLLTIIIVALLIVYIFGHIFTPFFVAVVIAYLLEWPVALLTRLKIPRLLAVVLISIIFIGGLLAIVLTLFPAIWEQVRNLTTDLPNIFNKLQIFVQSLPERFPELQPGILDNILLSLKTRTISWSETLISNSLSSLLSLASISIYAILVPLLVFFMLKDKEVLLNVLSKLLPKNRRLANRVAIEMSTQISNYIRGKTLEIFVVGAVTYITLQYFGLRYALLFSIATGFSVLVPYIGAALVTVPIVIMAMVQWSFTDHFWYVMIAYSVIQVLDGNVLVPIVFSEAVDLHPVIIIMSVLFFGGIWGFWGIFFAIPLASLVKAIIHAITEPEPEPELDKLAHV